jgi:hypothetical protein
VLNPVPILEIQKIHLVKIPGLNPMGEQLGLKADNPRDHTAAKSPAITSAAAKSVPTNDSIVGMDSFDTAAKS